MLREETETVVCWTLADERATVTTSMPKIARLCRRAGGEEIRQDQGIRNGRKETWTFLVDPVCIVIRRPRRLELTPEQRDALRERLGNARKSRNSPVVQGVGDEDGIREADDHVRGEVGP